MVRVIAVCSVFLLSLAGCQQAEAPASGPGDESAAAAGPNVQANVLTTEGLGPLRIGMMAPQLATIWGGPRAPTDPNEMCAIVEFGDGPPGVQAMLYAGEVRHIILSRFSTLKTDRGVGPGDTGAAVKAAYGASARVDPAKYDPAPAEEITAWASGDTSDGYVEDLAARGIRYNVSGDGTVSTVMAGGPTIQLAEGCG